MKLREIMNKKDYVSLEVAKLLKAKGFDEPCRYSCWRDSENDIGVANNKNSNYPIGIYSMPTLYEAQKWLREKYMIYISSLPTKDNGITVWYFQIVKDTLEDAIYSRVSPNTFNTYEEALNEGILEALKLI